MLMLITSVFPENERLPTSLGWRKKNETITLRDILTAVEHIRNATNLITGEGGETNASNHRSRDLHFGKGDL